MPLSEREQRLLEQIELDLQREDPDYVAAVTLDQLRRQRLRSLIVPSVAFLLGTVLLVAGLVTTHTQIAAGVGVAVVGVLTMTMTAVRFLRRTPG